MRRLVILLLTLAFAGYLAPTTSAQAVEPSSKQAVYQRFLDNFRSDQPRAVEAAKLYLEKFAADDDEVVRYLKKWVAKYEDATGDRGFQLLSIACGAGTKRTYLTRRGERLYYTQWPRHESTELAEAALERALASAEVVERRPILDERGMRLGERIVARRAARALVFRTDKARLVSIEAPSVEIIEEFERAGRP